MPRMCTIFMLLKATWSIVRQRDTNAIFCDNSTNERMLRSTECIIYRDNETTAIMGGGGIDTYIIR